MHQTELDPPQFSLSAANLHQVQLVKQIAYYVFGDERGESAECYIGVLLERKYLVVQCSRWHLGKMRKICVILRCREHRLVSCDSRDLEARS